MTVLLDPPAQPQQNATHYRIAGAESVDTVLASWRELEYRLGGASLACGATWTQSWIEVYGDVVPYSFFIAEAHGVVRGICLLARGAQQKNGPFPVRTLHLGTAGEPQPGSVCVEYNRILVEPAYESAFIEHLAAVIHADKTWEEIRLDGFAEPDLKKWLPHFPDAVIHNRDSRYFDLKSARESSRTVIESLGKSTRSNLRRRLRQYGELECEWAQLIEQADDIFEELIELHQARWQAVGQPGAFASPRFREFQRTACLKLFMEGKVVLFRVRHQNETVGCLLLLVDQNRLLDYLSGFADFEVQPSPGMTTHSLCMEQALARGFDAYDFLVGDKRHKENLSTDCQQLCWLSWTRPSLKSWLINSLRSLKRLARLSRSPSAAEQPER